MGTPGPHFGGSPFSHDTGAGQLSVPSCCSPIASVCSPNASASAAARRLRPLRISCCSRARSHPLQLRPLLAAAPRYCARFSMLAACVLFSCCSRSCPLRLLLPDCVRFECCSPIACIRLQPQLDSSPMFSNILRGVRGSVLKYEGRASL